MNRLGIKTSTIILRKAIFLLLFAFLTLGDWHVHTVSTHPCETDHSSIESPLKWHPHESCEDVESSESHEDLSGTLLQSKFDPVDTPLLSTGYSQSSHSDSHSENCHECHTPLFLHSRLCESTILLI